MERSTESTSDRFRRIGMFELILFLLSCSVHYFAYESQGSLPFSSELNVLFLFSWAGIAIVMLYAGRVIGNDRDVSPRHLVAVALIYGMLFVNWAIGTVPMLVNGKIPLAVRLAAPLPWLLLRGWFSWLLIGGAIRLTRAARTERLSLPEPQSS